jgi:hypothetical protein
MAGLIEGALTAKMLWPGLKSFMEDRYPPGGSPIFSSNLKWFTTYRTSPTFGIFRIKGASNET